MVGYDDGRVQCYGFVCNGACEIDGQEDSVGLAAGWVEGCFEKEPSVVPGIVGEGFGVAVGFVSLLSGGRFRGTSFAA